MKAQGHYQEISQLDEKVPSNLLPEAKQLARCM
jgi:hypothetical protein